MFRRKDISRWVERETTKYLAEDDRTVLARREQALKPTRLYWLALAACGALLGLGLMDHANIVEIRGACVLAAIVVCLKFMQLMTISVGRGQERK